MIQEYDVIKSTRDLTDKVKVGCIGTVLMIFDTAYEIEFVNDSNDTIDVLTVAKDDVVKD